MSQAVLSVKDIWKSFAEKIVLSGITFDLHSGEILALLGPSGCGKSTLLAIIAGIEQPERGDIFWKESMINAVPPHRRGFGLMFQEDVLFPHMNVFENVAFGLRMKKNDPQTIRNAVIETLELVGLQSLQDRNVNTLSGGEQQRVALARSLAPQPGLLMLDEPLSSLDRTLSERLLVEIRRILQDLQQTAIYVTHDQEEAFSIADRVVLMRDGNIEQIGTPEEIYCHPSTEFAARFLGLSNFIHGTAIIEDGQSAIESDLGKIPFTGSHLGPVTIIIRPDAATINGDEGLLINGRVIEKTFQGSLCQVIVSWRGNDLKFIFMTNTIIPEKGEAVQLAIDPSGVIPIIDE